MKEIHAVWKNGNIVPTQPVDWPEGTALAVEPIEESLVTDPEGDLLGDDPASIARWLAWFDSLEPFSFTPAEEATWEAARRERRDWEKSRFDERAERLKGLSNEAILARYVRHGRSHQSPQGRPRAG